MPCHRRCPANGFTLIELTIVLAIAAVALRAAVPGMARGVAARALSAQVNEFVAALRFARSEALKRGTLVTVCAAKAATPGPQCQSAHGADWRDGWLVFVDAGALGRPGELLRVQQALAHSGGVPGTRASISFTASGVSTDASSHYLFSPPSAAANDLPASLMVCVSKQGRARVARAESCA